MSMPEAAMNQDDLSMLGENDIRAAWKILAV